MSCSFITYLSSLTMSTLTPVYRCTEYLPVQFGNSHPISHCVQCPAILSQISPVSQCPHLHQSTDARNTYLYSLVTPSYFTLCTMSCRFITDVSILTMSTLTPVYRYTEYIPVQFGNSHPISHCVQCPVVLSQISPVAQCPHVLLHDELQ